MNGRNALTWEQKFALDVWYVDHMSLALDVKIIALTIWKIIKREGISQPGQATAEEFMGTRCIDTRVLILGAGGHAQVVADILLWARDAGQPVTPIGYLDDDASLHGKVLLDLPVLGDTSALERIPHDAVIIAIGNNQIRKRLADELSAAGGPSSLPATLRPSSLLMSGSAPA